MQEEMDRARVAAALAGAPEGDRKSPPPNPDEVRGTQTLREVAIRFGVEEEALLAEAGWPSGVSSDVPLKDLAVSSGSACTSASLEPSYVLRALGLSDELAHSSIRFSIGRFTTDEEIDYAVQLIKDAIGRLREMSPLWDMFKDGVDLSKVEWVSH